MTTTQEEVRFRSRLSARALVGGTLISLSSMMLLMMLAGALDLWNIDSLPVYRLTPIFWLWSGVSWVVSIFVGALTAGMISRPFVRKDALLNSVLVWASVSVLVRLGFMLGAGQNATAGIAHIPTEILWGLFGANVAALAASVLAGSFAFESERKTVEHEAKGEIPMARAA